MAEDKRIQFWISINEEFFLLTPIFPGSRIFSREAALFLSAPQTAFVRDDDIGGDGLTEYIPIVTEDAEFVSSINAEI